jgi:hypothetical protein
MNRSEKINEIKLALKALLKFSDEKKFSDFVLTDGSKITTSAAALEIGVEIYAVDDLGNQTPLDNGEYVLNDGRTITIVDNILTEISGEASTEDESPVSDASVKMEDGMPEAPSDEGDLSKRVTDLEAQLEEILNMLKTITETTQATQTNQEKVFSEFNKIKDEPGDDKVKIVKKGYDEYSSKKVNSRRNMAEIEELRKLIGERQKNNNNLL